ncbi:unnamed protein product, partial [Mesorhabditis spiculigera]
MLTEVKRDNFKSFWDKYSDTPDNTAMMLNNNAGTLEEDDRRDILSSLPDVTNKDAVDIGAGIGRFTTVLAQTARWVLTTDFIDSFIKKNKERNAQFDNVHYQVGDAVHLRMEDSSVDLVFTNWLMMYLSDREVIEFLMSAMRWSRPNGCVHLRESCTEPSTGRTTGNTLHNHAEANPTHYRDASLYIKLLKEFRYRDAEGKLWRFDVLWSCSVPTYIKRMQNWRQVHWLAKKVPAEEGEEKSFDDYLELFSITWQDIQNSWNEELEPEQHVWTDQIFDTVLGTDAVPEGSTAYVYTPRVISPYCHVDSHRIAQKLSSNVWNVELDPYYYTTSLTRANTVKDKRVRYGWNENLQASVDYWKQRGGDFNALVATELLATNDAQSIRDLVSILNPSAKAFLLEPVESIDKDELSKKLTESGFKTFEITDITDDALHAQRAYFEAHKKPAEVVGKHWVLIEATL